MRCFIFFFMKKSILKYSLNFYTFVSRIFQQVPFLFSTCYTFCSHYDLLKIIQSNHCELMYLVSKVHEKKATQTLPYLGSNDY